ncbi:MAG TPA: alpha/beta hydrolase [Thermoanaerobaculales bacterium]|nr:alpha/beta hydrolase [Thermoanaerobaculales bacterium]
MTDFRIDTPRGPIAGTESGHGPALVLVAGLGSSHRIWGDLPSLLGRRFTVLAIDNRGIGGSRAGHPFSLTDAALDVVAAVDGRGHHRFALLGASMGGVIALAAAIAAPRRTGCLVLASCAARLTRHGRRSLELLRDLLQHLPPDRVGPALMTIAFAPAFARRFPGLVEEAARLYGLDPADQPGATDQVERLLVGWDLRPQLAELEVPALVLSGDHDPIVAPEDSAELAGVLPRAELMTVTGAAHSVLAEGGREVLQKVVDFLAAHVG